MRTIRTFILLLLATLPVFATGPVEHVLCFPANFRTGPDADPTRPDTHPLTLQLTIGTATETTVRISRFAGGYDTTFSMSAMATSTITLPSDLCTPHRTGVTNNAILVTTSAPVSIAAFDAKYQSSESFTVRPTLDLGMTYTVMSYAELAGDLTGMFNVIATENNTMVTITGSPSSANCDPSIARPISVSLQRGQVYTYVMPYIKGQACDPSGMRISATAPVAVISGHNCAYVPEKCEACNPLYEQLLPSALAGRTTFVPPLAQRNESIVRVLAAGADARVTINDQAAVVVKNGLWWQGRRDSMPLTISSDAPVQIALYGMGYKCNDSVGDPCMILVPSVEEYAREQLITTAALPWWKHVLTVMCRPGDRDNVSVDGTVIDASRFVTDKRTGARYAIVPVSYGVHRISSASPVGVYASGIGSLNEGEPTAYDAYGHAGATVLRK